MVLALGYLHERKIIYRDLKPENVLLDKDGYIRITDFGLSKSKISGQIATSICGTPEYLAPEILLKMGHGKQVDWWTLGCIMYELCTGLPPYYSQVRTELFYAIKNKPVIYPSDLSESFQDLVNGLLNKDPAKRLGFYGAQDIQQHSWFEGFDWDKLLNKQLQPPFVPKLSSETDLQNFDKEFTDLNVNSVNKSSKFNSPCNFSQFDYAIEDSVVPKMAQEEHKEG